MGVVLLSMQYFNANSQVFKTEKGQVEFVSEAPLNKFSGKSSVLKGLIDFDQNLLDFYLDLNTLKTGIGLRDRHMRENYLETDKFPFAEFTGKLEPVPPLEEGKETAVNAIGKFKIHGIERDLRVTGSVLLKNNLLTLKTSFQVRLGDHDIEVPKIVFYELAEEQAVHIDALFTKTQ
ncbi:MAG: YceI family protein [Lunatimonas sp.]|nr:YceI family protein [Lunatimonas sp.]